MPRLPRRSSPDLGRLRSFQSPQLEPWPRNTPLPFFLQTESPTVAPWGCRIWSEERGVMGPHEASTLWLITLIYAVLFVVVSSSDWGWHAVLVACVAWPVGWVHGRLWEKSFTEEDRERRSNRRS